MLMVHLEGKDTSLEVEELVVEIIIVKIQILMMVGLMEL